MEFLDRFCIKDPNMKFHESSASDSRVDIWDRRTDMARLIGSFRDCANSPGNDYFLYKIHQAVFVMRLQFIFHVG
jgi:hypothetical protein